MSKLEGPKFN